MLARAREYQASGAFTGESTSRLQALAYTDLLNGVGARDRIAFAASAAAGLMALGEDRGPAGPDDGPGPASHPAARVRRADPRGPSGESHPASPDRGKCTVRSRQRRP